MGNALWNDHVERESMVEIGLLFFNVPGEGSLHAKVAHLRDEILKHYVVKPKDETSLKAWLAQRSFLRQPAIETARGEPALCGELSRLVIKVLRAQGVQARRVYLYQSPATNHVVFEYQDPQTRQWYLMDSYASTDYLRDLLDRRALSSVELLTHADPHLLIYDKFGYLPKSLFFRFGEPFSRSIPYNVSWWFEEIYLLKSMGFAGLAALGAGLWFWMGLRVRREGKELCS